MLTLLLGKEVDLYSQGWKMEENYMLINSYKFHEEL